MITPINFVDGGDDAMRRRFAEYLAKCCCGRHDEGADVDRLAIASVALRMIADGGDAVALARDALTAMERIGA